jgi:hypothetical protein
LLTFGHGTECQNATLALEPIGAPELLLEGIQKDDEKIAIEANGENVKRGSGTLAQVPLGGHLREIVIVKVEIVVINVEGFLAVGADPESGGRVGRSRGVGGIVAFEIVGFSAIVARLDVRVLIRYVCIVCIAFEPEEIVFSVYHAIEENGSDASKDRMERWDESDVLVFVFCGVEHVFCDVWHFWHEFVGTGCEKEDESLADVGTDKGVVIRSTFEETCDKSVDVDKERLAVYGNKVGET